MKNNIKKMREARKFSQEKLADLVGTSKGQIVKLERGERRLTVDWMERLASALGCDMADLLPQKNAQQAPTQAPPLPAPKQAIEDISALHPAEALARFDIDLLAQAMEMVEEQAQKFTLGKRAKAENLILTYMILLRDRASATKPAKPEKTHEKRAKKA